MRVIVGVEPHRNVQLGSAVRVLAAQVLAQRRSASVTFLPTVTSRTSAAPLASGGQSFRLRQS